ncbi:major facilitator superfamily domain-containing protein [Xylariales sp. PMI_506]|nr:major facilitator superfamily domain-containing protein [Xylariales sp. PMI_506]
MQSSDEASVEDLEKNLNVFHTSLSGDSTTALGNTTAENLRTITGIRWVLVCVALYISILMYGLDTTIAADVQAAVVETYGAVDQLAWLGAGFPLGSVAVILPYGALFISFNMKWLYIGGIVLFQAGSALCGAAPSMAALIVGRVLAGVGGTGMYLGGLSHFSALTTREERSTYITGITFVWGIGSILGPVVGGAFSVSSATWRWAFYLNLIVGAITAPMYIFFLPSVRPVTNLSVKARILSLDYLGFALSTAAWVAFGLVLVSAGALWTWKDGRTIATFVAFGVTLVAYILQQYFCLFTTPATRSFPAHLLRSRTQILLYVTTSASITTLYIPAYYIPVYFQFVQSDSALMAAVRLLPFILVTVAVNLASGFALVRVKYYMPFYVVSGVLVTLAGALLYVYLTPSTPTSTIYGISVINAAGTGLALQLGYAVATLKVESHDVGNAVNLQNISQVGSTMIGLVLGGQVFQNISVRNLSAALAGQGFSEAEIHNAVAGTQSTLFDSLTGELRDHAVQAITGAIQSVFILVLAAGAILIVVGAVMKRERLFGDSV